MNQIVFAKQHNRIKIMLNLKLLNLILKRDPRQVFKIDFAGSLKLFIYLMNTVWMLELCFSMRFARNFAAKQLISQTLDDLSFIVSTKLRELLWFKDDKDLKICIENAFFVESVFRFMCLPDDCYFVNRGAKQRMEKIMNNSLELFDFELKQLL